MLLSYHPCYEGDENRLCAGRAPDESDRAAMEAADGVVLPQGCRKDLFEMATACCDHVFPNYHARFAFPGKTGQAWLFKKKGVCHPYTEAFPDLAAFYRRKDEESSFASRFTYPFVFKFDWSGEGVNVRLVRSDDDFKEVIRLAETYEQTGQKGFVIQEFIPARNRCLRVVVIGKRFVSYWRVGKDGTLGTALSKGAEIDREADPVLQERGIQTITGFCRATGINLAGFDLLFDETGAVKEPFLLEINYFFGRRGLGGSFRFYEMLCAEIDRWRADLNI